MNRLVFHRLARREARETALSYRAIRPQLGEDFRFQLSVVLDRIEKNPLMYATIDGRNHVARLRVFPYIVVYQVLDELIWIVAVGHSRRRPKYWSRRRPE